MTIAEITSNAIAFAAFYWTSSAEWRKLRREKRRKRAKAMVV